MLIILLASTIGIMLGLYVDFYLCMVLCFLLILFGYLLKYNSKKIIMFIGFVIVFYVYTVNIIWIYDNRYIDGNMNDNFKIISYKEGSDFYDKYIAKNTKGDKFLIYLKKGSDLKKGSIIYGGGEFVLPDTQRNEGGFNFRRYLNSQKIFGSVFIENYYLTYIAKFNFIYFIQDEIYETLGRIFPKNEMGLILGMMIGETKDISDDVMESFRETGITHLVAVSGSNVMYVLILVQIVFKKLIGKKHTYFVSIIFIIIFMLISGASSSVIRASIMTILMIGADIFYQKSDTIYNISISALILMIINPLIIYDVGFILSFGGTIGIVLLSKDFQKLFKKFGRLSETLAVTCSAQIVLAPIMAYYFNSISILSIITNLIVGPISGCITILGFVIFIISKIYFPFAKFLSNSLYILATFTIQVGKFFSKIKFSNLKIVTPNFLEIIIFYFAIFYLNGKINFCCFKKEKYRFISSIRSKKWISCFLIFFVFIEVIYYNFPKNYIDVNLIDVGQGDSIYIETNRNKKILIDGGGSETYDVGENILVPYLLDKRVVKIDCIFSSHSDADHLNGLITVLENFKVGKVFIAKKALGYEKLLELADKKNIKVIEISKGDKLKIDDSVFEVIWPDTTIDNKDVNAYSLVLKLIYGEKSMLLAGDVSENMEDKLKNIKSDILKVAHHGSKTSSSKNFIDRVRPSIAVISVGENNKFGHPADEVLKRLKKYSKIYTTSEHGEIKIKIYKDKILVE